MQTSSVPFWRQLRWRLIVYFVLLAIVPLVIVVTFALAQMRTQAERQVINQLESVAELKQDQIDRWIETNVLVIDSFLSNEEKRTLLTDFVLSTTPSMAEQTAIGTTLHDLTTLRTGSYFDTFMIYNRAGRIVAASDSTQIGKVVANQPFFASSLETAKVHPPYYTVGTGSLVMMITEPLRGPRGQTVGVLAGEVNLAALGKIMLERTGLGASGETYLVSQENNYLITPSRWPDYPSDRTYHSQGIDKGLQGEHSAGIYQGYHAMEVIGTYRPVPVLNAALLAELSETEAQVLFAQTANFSIALTTITVLVAILIGLFVATHVSRPITSLAQAAARITAGSLDQRAAVVTRDEIGVLATGFNQMTDRLQQTLAGLEQHVADRTAELGQANAEAQQALAELRESVHERELLSATVRELASPVLPVHNGILVMPLIGVIDTERIALLMQSLLYGIEHHRASFIIIDVTGVPLIDTQVAQVLMRAADAARLLGAKPILVGLRPELAQTIVGLGLNLQSLVSCADLQSGISYALEQRSAKRRPA